MAALPTKPRVRVKAISRRSPYIVESGTAFDAAGQGRRGSVWQPTRESINTILAGNLSLIRARSRDQARNNPFAKSALDTLAANLVGTGIKPQVQIADEALRQQVQDLWLRWKDEADADGIQDLYGLQSMAARSIAEAGEVLVRFRRRRPGDSLGVPLQLQLIEAEHLDETDIEIRGLAGLVRNGIEFDAIGRRAAYWLYQSHPGDYHWMRMQPATRVRIPASEVMHLYSPMRPGQVRGVPWLASVLTRLYELDQYEDAELVRKKTAAMFSGFLQKPIDADAGVIEGPDPDQDDDGVPIAALEPGTMNELPPGYEVKFAEPTDVGGTYEVWIRQQLRAIAAGIGVTYEQMTGDLTGVNYSSIRAGLLEFRRRAEAMQHNVLVFQFCRAVWSRWIAAAVQVGTLPAAPLAASGVAGFPVKWVPPGWSWVDPVKEISAVVMAIRAGLVSRSEAISEYGYDADEIDAEIARDNERADRLGIVLDSDPRHMSRAGVTQARPDGSQTPDYYPNSDEE